MKMKMTGDQVLLKMDEAEADHRGMATSDAGVIHRALKVWSGVVRAIGPGKRIPGTDERFPPQVDVGDRVQCENDCGTEINVPGYGTHLLVREKFIQFVY